MIYQERNYRIKTGRLAEFVHIHGEFDPPPQKLDLGSLIAISHAPQQ